MRLKKNKKRAGLFVKKKKTTKKHLRQLSYTKHPRISLYSVVCKKSSLQNVLASRVGLPH